MKKIFVLLAVLAVLSGYITLETKISRKAEMAEMNVELDNLIAEMGYIRDQVKKISPCEIFFEKNIGKLEAKIKACRETDSWGQKIACRGEVVGEKIDLIKNISIFITKQKITPGKKA